MTPGTATAIQAVASIFEAIGTVGAVVVALFLQVFRVRRQKPRLSLSVDQSGDDDDVALVEWDDQLLALRFKVHNKAGKTSSVDTQVLLSRVVKPPGHPVNTIPTRNLSWADTPSDYVGIAGGTWRRVDVLFLIANRPGEDPLILAPALREYDQKWPPIKRHRLLIPGRYDFHLVVTANNCDATHWWFSFEYKPATVAEIFELRGLIDNIELQQMSAPVDAR